jgi:hypothetical protein
MADHPYQVVGSPSYQPSRGREIKLVHHLV